MLRVHRQGYQWRARRRRAAAALMLVGTVVALTGERPAVRAVAQPPMAATAVLSSTAGEVVGGATFTQQADRVRVEVAVTGLPPGFHGFHVHAVGRCEPETNFASAGPHLNPGGHTHAEHGGDQPNLYVTADGTGMLAFMTDRYTVADLLGPEGTALIVHALPDNFANIPARYAPAPDEMTLATGDSGPRIACGVIQPAS